MLLGIVYILLAFVMMGFATALAFVIKTTEIKDDLDKALIVLETAVALGIMIQCVIYFLAAFNILFLE